MGHHSVDLIAAFSIILSEKYVISDFISATALFCYLFLVLEFQRDLSLWWGCGGKASV